MQNKDLLFWILNSDKKPVYVNNSKNIEVGEGVLKTDGTPAHLEHSPNKWKDIVVNWARNIKYLGLFRDFSIGLSFVLDGGKILKSTMWNTGMEAVNYLSVSKLNRQSFPDLYEHFYRGEFDFSKYRQTDTSVEIDIVEGGLSKLLKAYESTSYEIRVDNDPDKISVYLDGLTFTNKVSYAIYDQEFADIGGSRYWELGTGTVSNEGTSQGVILNDQQQEPNLTPDGNNAFFESVSKSTSLSFFVALSVFAPFTGNTNVTFAITKTDKNGTFISDYIIGIINNPLAGSSYNLNANILIPILPNQKLFLTGEATSGLPVTFKVLQGSMDLSYDVRFDPTLCEAISWYTLFERLVAKITNGKYGVKSSFLKTLTDQCVTGGQAIRKYQSQSHITTTLNDFFQACRRWGVGLGIENDMLVIEKYDYFFKPAVSLNLGVVKDLEISVAEDLVFNTIKAGYKNQTYDKVNGKDEFNVTQQYTTPHTRIVKGFDIVSPYRADMFGIELTRLELFGKDSTDNSADNDTFMLNIAPGGNYDYYRGGFSTQINTGNYYVLIPNVVFELPAGKKINFNSQEFTILGTSYLIVGSTFIQVAEPVTNSTFNQSIVVNDPSVYKLNRPPYSAITGLINPDEAFNIELSPKESIYLNASFIHSVLDYQDAGKIVFQSGEKNSKLSRTLAGRTVAENSDIQINELPAKLFKPYYFKFKTKVPIGLPDAMKISAYNKVSFDYKGNTYTGFIWDVSISVDGSSQDWQLLCGPENDLTKLI